MNMNHNDMYFMATGFLVEDDIIHQILFIVYVSLLIIYLVYTLDILLFENKL